MTTQQTILQRLTRSDFFFPVLLALMVRLAAFPLAHLEKPEFWEYGEIARNMLAGLGYAMRWYYIGHGVILNLPSAFMPPGQVLLIYAGLKLFGNSLAGYIALFLLEVGMNVVFVYATGQILRFLFRDQRIVRLGLWMLALYPSFIVASTSFGVISAVLMLDSLFVWALLALVSNMRENRPLTKSAIATGGAAGLITLFRSESIAVLALTFALVGWMNRDLVMIYWKRLSLIAVALLCVASPWVIRNYMQFHQVIVGSTSGKFNFWRGHNPNATGSSWNEFGEPIWTTDTMWNEMEPGLPVDSSVEFVNADYHWKKATEWIAAHPSIEAERTLRKFVLFWGIDWYSSSARRWPYILTYSATFALLVMGAWRLRKLRPWQRGMRGIVTQSGLSVIALWCLLYTVITMVFFSLPRLQIILVGVYFPIVVYGADGLVNWVKRLRKRREEHLLRRPIKKLSRDRVFTN